MESANIANDRYSTEDVNEKSKCCSTKCNVRYTNRQWIILTLFGAIVLYAGFSYSIQAPFYPKLAMSKAVSTTVYSLVFGIFELVNVIACPIYGRYLNVLPIRPLLICSMIVAGTSCILFGLLDLVENRSWFISLSFGIRIIEALGQSAYITTVYAIIPYEFPLHIGKTFSVIETCFAIGSIIGPAAGGLLNALGGYFLPFAVTGCLIIAFSYLTHRILPEITKLPARPTNALRLFKIPGMILSYYVVTAISFSFGFVQVLLYLRIKQFKLSDSMVGLMFIINGATYGISAFGWGYAVDKGVNAKLLSAIGGCIVATGFALLGPVPFVPIQAELWMVILALALQGLGAGGEYICTFATAIGEAFEYGFPDSIETYGLVSGLWVSGFGLGNFLGTTISGVLYDSYGFPVAALVVFLTQILAAVLNCLLHFYSLRRRGVIDVSYDKT